MVVILVVTGRAWWLFHEQAVGLVLTAVYWNLLAVHFAYRVRTLVSPAAPPASLALSLAPRRLRDDTRWPIEAVIAFLAVLAVRLSLSDPHPPVGALVWLVYLQVGLLLLKVLFIHARVRFPAARVEEFERWRAGWLTYHLRVFDGLRLFLALRLPYVAAMARFEGRERLGLAIWMLLGLAFTAYAVRERRRLGALERELRPHELARDLRPAPVAEGRFLAGGLLHFNPQNPTLLARSATGIAVNLAHRATFLWGAYLVGLILLAIRLA